MAGKPKKRIDYAGWSVDIFSNDIKIDKLLDAQGWTGFGIYFYLCQMAFGGEGYYYEWCYDLCATTARKMGGGVGAGTVKEVVDYCLRIGLFDKGLFDRWGVLTSRGIQKSYLAVVKGNSRRTVEIYKEYWLLDMSKKEDYQGVVFVRKNNKKNTANDDLQGADVDLQGANDNSIVLNGIVLNNRERAREVTRFEEFLSAYPKDCNRYLTEREYNSLLLTGAVTEDELVQCAKNYAEACRINETPERYIKNAENFLKEFVFGRYLPGKYKKPTAKPKNSFNNFEQRKYDFGELEKQLLNSSMGGMQDGSKRL